MSSIGFEVAFFDEENFRLRFESTLSNNLTKQITMGGVPEAYVNSKDVNIHFNRFDDIDKTTIIT